jgi:hypothetical protein
MLSNYLPGKKVKNIGGLSRFITTSKTSNQDLNTSQGLYSLAVQSGLKNQADKLVSKQQGETGQIFSGGIVSDFFDVLNTLDYGVVGMLKGKSFMEGIKNRESFADEDALGKDLLGKTIGTVLDIAVDPLTYIAPATILKKIPGAAKLGKAVKGAVFGEKVTKTIADTGKTFETVEGGTKAGKWLADKFVYMFGKDPMYRKAWERSEKNIAVGQTAIKEMSKGIINLSKEKASKLLEVGKDGRFIRTSLDKLKGILDEKEFANVKNSWDYLDDLGRQAVENKLLTKDKWEENIGEYLKASYKEYEEKKGGFFAGLAKKIKGIKARKSEEAIAGLTKIDNPAYLFFKSSSDLLKDIENTKFFNEVADKFGSKTVQDGFELVKDTRKTMGALAGKYIPKPLFDDITALNKEMSNWEKWSSQNLVGNFKLFKVVMNPASHFRNMMSNKLLNNFDEAGMPLWRLDKDIQGWKSVITKDKWYDEVKKLGGDIDTFSSRELGDILNPPPGLSGKVKGAWDKTVGFLSDMYQKEELGAKMTMYRFQRGKGLSSEDAWKIAERATFNYAQVTPFIRKLRTSLFGFPFITFTVKSAPVIAKTALTSPTKISNIGKIRNNIEKLSNTKETEKERASEPSWVKNGFYVKLPMKDEKGRSAYFDLTYILPFGDLINLGDETNLNILKKNPVFNLITEIGNNKDFYGNKIWRDSDPSSKQLGDLMRHLSKTALPPAIADIIPGGYNEKTGEQRKNVYGRSLEASGENLNRTVMQELLRQVGMKVQPIEADIQENYQEWNIKKALKTLLQEQGITKEFERTYVPKK